ncbi:putative ribonuclease H-like domain-containing protein [Tanacetum coccineum]
MTYYSLREVILNGNKVLRKTVGEIKQEYEHTSAEEKQDRRNVMKARGTLLMALPNKNQLKFHEYKNAKLLMEAIEKRLQKLISQVEIQGEVITQEDMNLKLVRSLPSQWKTHALIWGNKVEIETISLDDLYNNLKISESEIKGSTSTNQDLQNMAFVSSKSTNVNKSSTNKDNTAYGVSTANTQGNANNTTFVDNLSDAEMAMLTIKARSFIKRTGKKLDMNGQRIGFDRSKVECFNCHKNGHFFRECRFPRNQENRGRENGREIRRKTITVETPIENVLISQDGVGGYDWSYQAEEEQPPNFVLMAYTSSGSSSRFEVDSCSKLSVKAYATLKEKYDSLNSDYNNNAKKVETNNESAKGDAVEPKIVRTNNFSPPIIKDWKSNDKSEEDVIPKVVDKTVKEYKQKRVFDSGCSRHMTGNKCFLSEYEDHDGGLVSLGDGKGRIFGKGKIKLVLSFYFKLPHESQVLLRVPRKDNIYSVDLKSVVPTKGLTCQFAKATTDESNLWHRRLGHINFKNINKLVKGNLVRGLPSMIFENDKSCVACQKGKQHKAFYKAKLVNSVSKPLHMLHMDLFGPTNVRSLIKKSYCLVVTDDYSRFSWVFFLATKDETSGILKTFITGIENRLDSKVKVIKSDNGTEFKNNVMNMFCKEKGIKREFSVARTP